MTCGINLGILLICLLQAVHVCCSWALYEGKGSQTHNGNTYVGLSHVHSSHPQDEFRQAYVFQSSSPPTDTEANGAFIQGLSNRQYTHTASGFRHTNYPSVKYFKSPLANPKWLNVDSYNGNVPQKQALGPSSSMVSGSSVSKHDSSYKHNGISRTWPEQQGTRRTSQYASSKSDFLSPSRGSHLFPSGSNKPVAWKPHNAALTQQGPSSDMGLELTDPSGSVLNPLKELVQTQTSGIARGRRVNQNGGSRNHFSQPSRAISNPETFPERYEQPIPLHFALHQSHQVSAYNQNPPLGRLQTGTNSAPAWLRGHDSWSGRLGPGQRFAPTKIHDIPPRFGGYAIRRLTDEEPTEPVTTQRPVQTYTFPPRQTESLRPQQPSVHHKSKWMRIRSNQLTGGAGVHGRIFS